MISGAEADTELFADTLSFDDAFPLELHVARGPLGGDAADRAEAMLRALAALEEPVRDESEETPVGDAALARVEAKVDVALALLAALVRRERAVPAPALLRWSRRGLRMSYEAALPPATPVIVDAYLSPSLPLAVELPLEVVTSAKADAGALLWLRFAGEAPALKVAIERQLFRRHRRRIAEQRRQG